MPQLEPKLIFKQPATPGEEDFNKVFTKAWDRLKAIINKGIRFSDNFDLCTVEYTTNGTPDTEDTVAHDLKRLPVGFLVVNKDKAVDVYDSGTTWTTTNIYLKASVASAAVTVYIF